MQKAKKNAVAYKRHNFIMCCLSLMLFSEYVKTNSSTSNDNACIHFCMP